MDQATADKLNAINRAFYSDLAAAFSETRAGAWSGWQRLLPHLLAAGAPGEPLSVLDVGCGNARFADFLDRELDRPVLYLGLDASATLLQEARERASRLGLSARFEPSDLVEAKPRDVLAHRKFDCVVALGLLHHVPGARRREELVRALAEAVGPGGMLVLSFWDFGGRERFERRRVDWDEHNRDSTRPLDLDQLEPGDTLLRWGSGEASSYRYCHFASLEERERLTRASGLASGEAFEADGGLNDYRILCRG